MKINEIQIYFNFVIYYFINLMYNLEDKGQ